MKLNVKIESTTDYRFQVIDFQRLSRTPNKPMKSIESFFICDRFQLLSNIRWLLKNIEKHGHLITKISCVHYSEFFIRLHVRCRIERVVLRARITRTATISGFLCVGMRMQSVGIVRGKKKKTKTKYGEQNIIIWYIRRNDDKNT